MSQFQIKGVNSDQESCDKCGKQNLKRVVWLESLDADGNGTGEVIAVGTTCAAKLTGFNGNTTDPEVWVQQKAAHEKSQIELEKVRVTARRQAAEFKQDILIFKGSRSGYYTVRERAYNANPNRYKDSYIGDVKFPI